MSEKFATFISEWVYPRATFLICAALAVVSVVSTLVAIVAAPASGEAIIEIAENPAKTKSNDVIDNSVRDKNFEGTQLGPMVHVVGAVKNPGLVQTKLTARVIDAIELAGGLETDADQSGINFARFINDGEQIYVPRIGELGYEAATLSQGNASGKININRANATELESLPRIGPAMAAKIVSWRDANGSFTDLNQLMNVAGIGQKTFDGLVDFISL